MTLTSMNHSTLINNINTTSTSDDLSSTTNIPYISESAVVFLSSFLSLFASLAVLFLYVRWVEFRSTQNRIMTYMGISYLAVSVVFLLQSIGFKFNTLHFDYDTLSFMGLASSIGWSLALPLNLCAVVFMGLNMRQLVNLERLYLTLFFLIPSAWILLRFMGLLPGTASSAAISFTSPFAFVLFPMVWSAFLAHFAAYTLLGSKIWWTRANQSSTTSGTRRHLGTTGNLVLTFALVWLIPSLQFASENFPAFAAFLATKLMLSGALVKTLSLASLGSMGFWMCFVHLLWALKSINSVRSYWLERLGFPSSNNSNGAAAAAVKLDERAPLLFSRAPMQQQQPLLSSGPSAYSNSFGSLFVGRKVVVKYEFIPERQDELHIQPGESVLVLTAPEGGWWKGTLLRLNGPTGWFPANYVETVMLPPAPANSPVQAISKSSFSNNNNNNNANYDSFSSAGSTTRSSSISHSLTSSVSSSIWSCQSSLFYKLDILGTDSIFIDEADESAESVAADEAETIFETINTATYNSNLLKTQKMDSTVNGYISGFDFNYEETSLVEKNSSFARY